MQDRPTLFLEVIQRHNHQVPASPDKPQTPGRVVRLAFSRPAAHLLLSPAPGFWSRQLQRTVQGFRGGAGPTGKPHQPGDQQLPTGHVGPTGPADPPRPRPPATYGGPRPQSWNTPAAQTLNCKPALLAPPFRSRPPTQYAPGVDHAP